MASRRSRPRRLLLPTVLAAVLAAEITGLALARTFAPVTPVMPAASAVAVAAPAATAGQATDSRATDGRPDAAPGAAASTTTGSSRRIAAGLSTAHVIGRADGAQTIASTKSTTTAGSGPSSGGHSASASYQGRNHVWIPSLGINKTVQSFPCSRTRPPDAGVYRWGCAGHNNVYLMGHAWSTFKPLHDAYVGGRLHTGMRVIYADGGGTVHTYSVIWWKVVAPTTAASWAWASLSTPGMTLQTCVGSNSQYRLMVRLVRVG
jgi:hypothetical protein